MKRVLPLIFLVWAFSVAAFSQSPTPTPSPDDVVKISTSLIQLDVTVTDKKGEPIRDLRIDEIEIYENGKRQEISNISFINSRRQETTSALVKTNSSNPGILPSTVAPRAENVRRTIAIVVDDLSMSFASIKNTRDSIKRFINEQMEDGDLVAIVRTGSGIGLYQQFTSDKSILLRAIDNIRFNLAARVDVFEPITQSLKEQLNGVKGSDGGTKDYSADIQREQEMAAMQRNFSGYVSRAGTFGTLNFIVRGMREMPGRKSVMFFSDGFAMFERDKDGRPSTAPDESSLRQLIEFANRSSVVFYTLDPKGLVVVSAQAGDVITDLFDQATVQKLANRENSFRDAQDGLRYLARETGGLAYLDQNDLNRGIQKVLNDQSYYLVAYDPGDDSFDPKLRRFNKLTVKVTRPGAQVRYRSGFFGVSDDALTRVNAPPTETLARAITSPFAQQDITLRFNPLFIADEKGQMYVRTFLHLDANDITIAKQADGTYRMNFEIAQMSVDETGSVIDLDARSYNLPINEEGYQGALKNGILYDFSYLIKKPGAIQYRMAVRDIATNKVGTANQFLIVPNVRSDKLALSGVLFESMTPPARTNSLTTIRQFRPGTNLRWGLDVYNFKGEKPDLTIITRVYKDGKLIAESKPVPATVHISSANAATITGNLRLGAAMPMGDHLLQVVVADNNRGAKEKVAIQFSAFEVIGEQ